MDGDGDSLRKYGVNDAEDPVDSLLNALLKNEH